MRKLSVLSLKSKKKKTAFEWINNDFNEYKILERGIHELEKYIIAE